MEFTNDVQACTRSIRCVHYLPVNLSILVRTQQASGKR